jgi:hypothetical protein
MQGRIKVFGGPRLDTLLSLSQVPLRALPRGIVRLILTLGIGENFSINEYLPTIQLNKF